MFLSDANDVSYRIEIGAQWIHGTKGNPVFDIAKSQKLLTQPTWPKFLRNDTIHMTTEGDILNSNLFKEISKWFRKMEDEFDDIYEKSAHTTSKDEGVDGYIRKHFEEYIEETQRTKEQEEVCKQILNHRMMYETSLAGCDNMDEISLQQYGSYVSISGPDPEIHKGYFKIVDVLASALPDECLKFNSPVGKICYDDVITTSMCNGPTVKGQKVNKPVTVELKDGSKECFDHVLVTPSLNFLKKNHLDLFEPNIPGSKQKAISKLGMGTVDKIFLQFEHLEFLDEKTRSIHFCWPLDADNNHWTSRLYSVSVCNHPKQDMIMCKCVFFKHTYATSSRTGSSVNADYT